MQRTCLADVLNQLLVVAHVRPCFTWSKTKTGIACTTNVLGIDEGALTLSGALAVQLVLACGRADSISTCSGCRKPYLRRWHSVTGRGNYCEDCGKRAVWRDSKRRRRADGKAQPRQTKRRM